MAVSVKSVSELVTLNGNPIRIKIESDLAVPRTFHQLHIELKFYIEGEWIDIAIESKTAIDNEATFDIRAYFESYFESGFSYPEHSSNLLIIRNGMRIEWIFDYWETYYDASGDFHDAPSSVPEYTTSHYTIKGGLSKQDYRAYNQANTDWYTNFKDNKYFLTYTPNNINIHASQTIKLYFIVLNSEITSVKLKTGVTTHATVSVDQYDMIECVVSPALLSLLDDYTVFLTDQADATISEEKSFVFTNKTFNRNDFFMLENSLGGYDSIWAHGLLREQININKDTYKQADTETPLLRERQIVNPRGKYMEIYDSELGYIDENNPYEVFKWLKEFLVSGDIYKFEDTRIVPVNILTKKVAGENDLVNLLSLPFNWQYAYENQYFSKFAFDFESLLPPFWEDIDAVFYLKQDDILLNLKNSGSAETDGTDLTYPEISGNDLLDFSDTVYWLVAIQSEGWYDGGAPRSCPETFMDGESLADFATDKTHNRFFFRDYADADIRKSLPIIVYGRDMTETEQLIIVDWLNWYFFTIESGDFITEDSKYITAKN